MKQSLVAFALCLVVLSGCTAEYAAPSQEPSNIQLNPPVTPPGRPGQSQPFSPLNPSERFPDAEVSNDEYLVNLNSVHKIQCGNRVGSGSTINTNRVLTASHVVGGATECVLIRDGVRVPARVIYDNQSHDYAVLDAPTGSQRRFALSCEGFVTGETYYIIGHAGGREFVITRAEATERFVNISDGESGQPFVRARVLNGRGIRGMSGGPIINTRGVQVGTIIAGPRNPMHVMTYAREIRHTYICNSMNNDGVKEDTPPSK